MHRVLETCNLHHQHRLHVCMYHHLNQLPMTRGMLPKINSRERRQQSLNWKLNFRERRQKTLNWKPNSRERRQKTLNWKPNSRERRQKSLNWKRNSREQPGKSLNWKLNSRERRQKSLNWTMLWGKPPEGRPVCTVVGNDLVMLSFHCSWALTHCM